MIKTMDRQRLRLELLTCLCRAAPISPGQFTSPKARPRAARSRVMVAMTSVTSAVRGPECVLHAPLPSIWRLSLPPRLSNNLHTESRLWYLSNDMLKRESGGQNEGGG